MLEVYLHMADFGRCCRHEGARIDTVHVAVANLVEGVHNCVVLADKEEALADREDVLVGMEEAAGIQMSIVAVDTFVALCKAHFEILLDTAGKIRN